MTTEAWAWNKNNSDWREMADSTTVTVNVGTEGKVKFDANVTPASGSITNAMLANMAAWSFKIRNAGTSGVPSDAALADFTAVAATASASVVGFLDSGEIRRFLVSTIRTGVTQNIYTGSDTWTKPTTGTVALIECWGGGGSGGRAGSADGGGGGGGGSYNARLYTLASLSASVTVTIGAGGAAKTSDDQNGATGGDTTFGAYVTGWGGGGGSGAAAQNGGGGGGGQRGAGTASATSINGGNGGIPRPIWGFSSGFGEVAPVMGAGSATATRPGGMNIAGGGGGGIGGNGAAGTFGGDSTYGGGGGGAGSEATGAAAIGGSTIWGGGGGGGGSSTTAAAAGGASLWGGAGGAGAFDANVATGGTAPGGGGGGSELGNSGAGGDGRIIVTVW